MISQWIAQARSGEPVWLGDVREAFDALEDPISVMLRLTGFSGQVRDFSLPLPRWQGAEERDFVEEYLHCRVFNALSVFSARQVTFYLDFGEVDALALLRRLPGAFQVDHPHPTGLGKTVQIARRLRRTFDGGEFQMTVEELSAYAPAPPPPRPEGAALSSCLARAVKRGETGLLCGIDVGGTDVKLALSRDGTLLTAQVLDWDPSASPTASGILEPIRSQVRSALDRYAPGQLLDGLGVSFPDVVIRDRIVGGETPKTRGMRDNPALDYEAEFQRITALREFLAPLCAPNAPIRIVNDGHMAAFTACMELSYGGEDVSAGVLAHSLGTDLGTGWVRSDGSIPEFPLELYDLLLDLGSYPARDFPPEDLRGTRNENSGLPGLRRYTGQAAAFRLAWERDPGLLEGYAVREGDHLSIRSSPDLRKPCLEHLMTLAQEGNAGAQAVFRQIGVHLGQVSRELIAMAHPETPARYLFGRFVKKPRCFALLEEGCADVCPQVRLTAADEELAFTPLMVQLSHLGQGMVAQYSQAVGAVYYSLLEAVNDEAK